MRYWTAHLGKDAEPVLVREGFSWGALIFGPLWLAAHRAWIPAAIALAAIILVVALTGGPTAAAMLIAVAVLLGLSGNDLRRWSMQSRGYALSGVIAARDETEALGRYLTSRPDLAPRYMPPERAQ